MAEQGCCMHACAAQVGASAHVTSLQLGRGERRGDGSRPDLLLANCADRSARLLQVSAPDQDAPLGFPASEAPQRMRTAKVRPFRPHAKCTIVLRACCYRPLSQCHVARYCCYGPTL